MKKILSILVCSMITLPMFAQLSSTADRQFTNEQYEEAFISYEKLLKQSPKTALYHFRYARCAQELNEYAIAIEEYQNFLDIKPESDQKEFILNQIKKMQKIQRYLRTRKEVVYLDSFDVAKKDILGVYQLSAEAGTLTQDSILFGCKNAFGNQWTYATNVDSLGTILVRQYRLMNMWGEKDTLPERVNQFTEQNTPYWLSDGLTLYFSANNPDGLGGLDIYVTRYNINSDTYTIPENLGMPFNSSGNDYLYVLDETKGVGYWATDRYSTPDSVRVYQFESTEPLLWTAE